MVEQRNKHQTIWDKLCGLSLIHTMRAIPFTVKDFVSPKMQHCMDLGAGLTLAQLGLPGFISLPSFAFMWWVVCSPPPVMICSGFCAHGTMHAHSDSVFKMALCCNSLHCVDLKSAVAVRFAGLFCLALSLPRIISTAGGPRLQLPVQFSPLHLLLS